MGFAKVGKAVNNIVGNAIAKFKLAGLVAYTYLPKKPSIDIYPKDLPALPPAIF